MCSIPSIPSNNFYRESRKKRIPKGDLGKSVFTPYSPALNKQIAMAQLVKELATFFPGISSFPNSNITVKSLYDHIKNYQVEKSGDCRKKILSNIEEFITTNQKKTVEKRPKTQEELLENLQDFQVPTKDTFFSKWCCCSKSIDQSAIRFNIEVRTLFKNTLRLYSDPYQLEKKASRLHITMIDSPGVFDNPPDLYTYLRQHIQKDDFQNIIKIMTASDRYKKTVAGMKNGSHLSYGVSHLPFTLIKDCEGNVYVELKIRIENQDRTFSRFSKKGAFHKMRLLVGLKNNTLYAGVVKCNNVDNKDPVMVTSFKEALQSHQDLQGYFVENISSPIYYSKKTKGLQRKLQIQVLMDGDLRQFLSTCSQLLRKEIIIKLIGAVQAMHQLGFSHGDIKPENIFLKIHKDKPIEVRLGDTDDMLEYINVHKLAKQGTILYMSPECLVGFIPTAGKHDVWAIGVVILECLGFVMKMPRMRSENVNKKILQDINSHLTQLHKRHVKDSEDPLGKWYPLLTSIFNTNPTLRPTIDQIQKMANEMKSVEV